MILLQAKDASLRFILNVENDNETDMVKKMLVSPSISSGICEIRACESSHDSRTDS